MIEVFALERVPIDCVAGTGLLLRDQERQRGDQNFLFNRPFSGG